MRLLKIAVCIISMMALVLVLFSVVTPQGRATVKTIGFILHVLPDVPLKPLHWFTSSPIKAEVFFPLSDEIGTADVYRTAGTDKAAVLLFLGVNPAGRDDERVINLAEGLARSGMVVMIPISYTMTQFRIDSAEVDNLVHAFQYLRNLEYVDSGRVGMAGFCVGASLSVVAAQDTRISDDVAFINFFGGYFDMKDLLVSIASGTRFDKDLHKSWESSDQAWKTFRNHLLESVENLDDLAFLTSVFVDEEVTELGRAEDLSPDAAIVYRLLRGLSLEEARNLFSQLPEDFRKNLKSISPNENLSNLKAKILIMHDLNDNNIPSEESRRLAIALKERGNFRHTEFVFFQHVDPVRMVNPLTWISDVSKLFFHLYDIIRIAA